MRQILAVEQLIFQQSSNMVAAGSLASISDKILDLLSAIPELIIGLALVYFLYGLTKYVTGLDEKKKKEAKDTMIYGIVGLFVMVSIWGIVAVARDALGI